MGWTFYPKPHDAKADLDLGLTWSNEDGQRRVLRSAMTLTNYYAAVEHTKPDGTREVWAATYLIRHTPNASDGCTFGYKDMTEHMGPYGCDSCPEAILDLLTEPTGHDRAVECALEWRARCRAYHQRRKLAKRVKPGTRVEFADELSFGPYGKFRTFTAVAYGKRIRFRPEGGHFIANISRWRERAFTIA